MAFENCYLLGDFGKKVIKLAKIFTRNYPVN